MWVNWMSRGMPTRPSLRATEARDPACARCGGPLSEPPPVAVPDLCGACITALHRAFEDRCRWESLATDTLAREAHQRRLGYADTPPGVKVWHLANDILHVYHQTLDGLQPLSPLEGVQFERRQEAAVATCAICLARVDVDRVVVRAGRWICDDCEGEVG